MARIVVGSYMIRYPLGGMMSWVLQYLVGFQRLGHDVFFVERSGYPNACYDPRTQTVSDDCTYGAAVVHRLLSRFGLGDSWCYLDDAGEYHGMTRQRVESVFRTADVFIDMGTHRTWLSEAQGSGLRVLLDGEPGFNQLKMKAAHDAGTPWLPYDRYYTNGMNIGTPASPAPTAGQQWGHVFHPVVPDLFGPAPEVPSSAPFTTVMNWKSHADHTFDGITYGNKDAEFPRFVDLPSRVRRPIELGVAGAAPFDELQRHGWVIKDANEITMSFDSFVSYVQQSRGEFSVCKHAYVALRTGWFSDRSGAYLAAGRPVIQQETGFSDHLPTGEGVFAVESVEEAADAVARIDADYDRHSRAARDIAFEYLDAGRVLSRFLDELGVEPAADVTLQDAR